MFETISVLLNVNLWMYAYMPETMGVPLECIDALFSGPSRRIYLAGFKNEKSPLLSATAGPGGGQPSTATAGPGGGQPSTARAAHAIGHASLPSTSVGESSA